MTDPFDLPERDLPEHIRQAAFRRIMTEIADVRPRRRTGLAPLLIAASVITLVAGATIVTSTLNNKDSKPLNASPTTPHPSTTVSGSPENGFYFYGAQRNWGTGTQMERCWSAEHKPDTWSPLLQVNRNGLRTIAVGTGDMTRLKLPYLSTSADVIAGDLLVTSGLGGGFPAGYPVGTITEVKRDPAQSLAEVEVRPAAALDRSREVMFVWLTPEAAASSSTPPPASTPAPASAPPPGRRAAAAPAQQTGAPKK